MPEQNHRQYPARKQPRHRDVGEGIGGQHTAFQHLPKMQSNLSSLAVYGSSCLIQILNLLHSDAGHCLEHSVRLDCFHPSTILGYNLDNKSKHHVQ